MAKYLIAILIALGLSVACLDTCDNNPTAPPVDPPAVTGPIDPPVPPTINPDTFPLVERAGNLLLVDGQFLKAVTAFALPAQPPAYAADFCYEMQQNGLNTARIFVETRNWTGAPGYLQQVAFDYDYEAVKATVEALGQAGCAVQIVISATVKEEPLSVNINLIKEVTRQFKDYRHIIWSVMNEYKHPSSHATVNSSGAAKDMLRAFKQVCQSCIVGIDESLRESTTKHRACSGTSLCSYFAWHPDRNDDEVENNRFFRSAKSMGQPVFFDEMIAFASNKNFDDYPILRGKCTIGQKAGMMIPLALCGREDEADIWRHVNEVYNMALDAGIHPCWHAIDQMLCIIPPGEMYWPQEH